MGFVLRVRIERRRGESDRSVVAGAQPAFALRRRPAKKHGTLLSAPRSAGALATELRPMGNRYRYAGRHE